MAELVPSAPMSALPSGGPMLQRVRSLAATPVARKALPWFVGVAALGGIALTYNTFAPAPQRVLYAQLSDAERAGVVSALDKAGIKYVIDNQTGTLTVNEDQLYRARMLVASDGAIAAPDAQAPLDTMPLGASRTLEGERLRAARERELMLTIKEIDGVDSVRVHLAEANRSVFVKEDTPPTASVMVRMASGRQLSESQVSAVVNLVAGSVPGMTPDAVKVIDQHGRLLSARDGAGSDRIELQTRMESKLRAQLDQLLTPMLGVGNFTSEVQLDLDLDEVTSARERYDKDGVVRSETQAQSQSSGASPTNGGIPGVTANTPPADTTAAARPPQPTTPTPGAPGNATTSGETSASRTYELGREVSVANAAPGKVRRLSVAVALSQAAAKKNKLANIDQIKQLVSAAVGADPARGDQVTVLIQPFEAAPEAAPPFYEASWFAMVVRSVLALVALLLVLLLAVRPLIRALKRGGDNDDSTGEPALPNVSANPAAGAVDAALLGRQVGLAQRIIEEKPDDALVALRQMLGNTAAAENSQ